MRARDERAEEPQRGSHERRCARGTSGGGRSGFCERRCEGRRVGAAAGFCDRYVLWVGGGISGLVAAYRLRQAVGPDATITVFDPADRLGGILRTERVGGQVMDIGAEAFVARRPEMPGVAGRPRPGWTPDLAGRNPPLIYAGARLHPLPAGTVNGIPSAAAPMSELVDAATVAKMTAEPSRPRCAGGPATTRPSAHWSPTGSAPKWWPGRWTRCCPVSRGFGRRHRPAVGGADGGRRTGPRRREPDRCGAFGAAARPGRPGVRRGRRRLPGRARRVDRPAGCAGRVQPWSS